MSVSCHDYSFELQVNGMYVVAAPCIHPNCHCMATGCAEENRKAVDELEPFIRAYITHFLDSERFDAFDEPLSTGAIIGEHS